MYTSFQLTKKYINHYFTSSNGEGHGIHSPFVFQFIKNVLNNQPAYQPLPAIEAIRKTLLKNRQEIDVIDMGAGSRLQATTKRKINTLAKRAVKPKKWGQLLYRIAKEYNPKTIVELGTSLGITTAYLATANTTAQVITIEGSAAIQSIASDNFKLLNLCNIESVRGNFDDILPSVLANLTTVDLAYIDGNHRLAPTINYFELFLSKAANDTILIFDDIHWSSEMEEAWEVIKSHPAVKTTIDLFFIGIVLLRNEFKTKQHFKVYF